MAVLARHAWQYTPAGGMSRPKADPLGLRGLPDLRVDLDRLVADLCDRLRLAAEAGLRGRQLAEELGLARGTRALRLLVAYAWVHRGEGRIVGVPGDGYYWGDARPTLYPQQAREEEMRGRDYLWLAALHRRQADRLAAQAALF